MKTIRYALAGMILVLAAGCEDESSKNDEPEYITICLPAFDKDGNIDPTKPETCTKIKNPNYTPPSYNYTYTPTYSAPSTPTPVTLDPSTGQ